MITTVRFAAVTFCLAAPALPAVSAAEKEAANPPVVIERAPESAEVEAQRELAELRTENRRLAADVQNIIQANERLQADLAAAARTQAQQEATLNDTTRELATLRARAARLLASENDTSELQKKAGEAQAARDALATKNQQLEATLANRTLELREAQARLAEITTARAAQESTAAAEKTRAEEAAGRLSSLQTELERLRTEKNQLDEQLARLRESESSLRERLAAAEQPQAPAAPDLAPQLAEAQAKLGEAESKLAASESKLAEATRRVSELESENSRLAPAVAEREKLTTELSQLREQLAARPEPAAEPSTDTTQAMAELEDKLATALRSYSLLQSENQQLKAAGGASTAAAEELEELRRRNADLEAQLAAAPTPAPDLSQQLAETEDKLETVLRSYSLLQAETEQRKAEAGRIAQESEAAASRAAADSARQISGLFDQLRQTRAQLASLAAENSQLKTRLAVSGSPPGSLHAAPARPGPTPAAAAPAAGEPEPAPETPRTHVVAAGDSLAKLSRVYYGTANRWDDILEANRDVIQNENVLPIGATLRIP